MDHLKRRQLADERRQFLERALCRNVLQDTGYNHQGKAPCDPDTRVEILGTIKEWVNDLSEESQNFFWLTGDPGSGKSAITASFARDCKNKGVLWAQFFINRNNESTTDPRFYFPSIAWQMAEHVNGATVTVVIHEILRKKEALVDEMTFEQGLEFFVKVVQAACDLDRSTPVAIIFDGLDETSKEHLENTATIFSDLFTKLERLNAKVFISSRTDDEITKPFYGSLQRDSQHVKHRHLDTSKSRKDVELYLRRNLEHLVKKWALDWTQWPGEEQFEKLCDRAGGLLIWAVTVVKFFRSQLERHGSERRNKLLDIFHEKGMGDVNRLYGTILTMTFESDADEWEYERFRWIVGFIIALKEPLTIGHLSALLDLRETPDSDPVDIPHFVTNLRTVLVAGADSVTNDTIPRLHKSFVEYITSKRVDAHFRIDVPVVDDQIATKCLRLVGRLRHVGKRALLPAESVRYAIHNWTRHLAGSKSGVGIVDCDEGLQRILSMTVGLRNLKGFLSASGDYRTHLYNSDIASGLPPPLPYGHSSTIQVETAIWAIAVSADGRLIASGGVSGVVQIWDARSHEPIGKPGKHNGIIFCVCFSPDSRWLISGSEDKSVRIWDCRTGQAIGFPLLGHTDGVRSVCIDDQNIISGSDDGTIRIWSYDTRQLVGAPIMNASDVLAVALSNGHIAAGVGSDVCIFNVETRQQIASMKGHSRVVWTVAFSANGHQIASGSEDRTIRIWDARTGKQMHRLDGHTDHVRSIAFSPDGQWIASGSHDKTLRMWHSGSGQLVGVPLTEHTDWVSSVTFSTDGCHIVSGSFDGTIRIWAALHKWLKLSQQITAIHLSRHPPSSPNDRISLQGRPSVISACYSVDGSLYAASTLEGRVSIWNAERELLWEANTSVHPIHLLRFSETQLILSALDGSVSSWNLMDGKPTHAAISCGPQLNAGDINQSASSADAISWLPFDLDAGVWAYMDGCFIRFEGEEALVTIIDVGDLRD